MFALLSINLVLIIIFIVLTKMCKRNCKKFWFISTKLIVIFITLLIVTVINVARMHYVISQYNDMKKLASTIPTLSSLKEKLTIERKVIRFNNRLSDIAHMEVDKLHYGFFITSKVQTMKTIKLSNVINL